MGEVESASAICCTTFLSWFSSLPCFQLYSSVEGSDDVEGTVLPCQNSTAQSNVIPTPFHEKCFSIDKKEGKQEKSDEYSLFQGVFGRLDDTPCKIEEGLFLGSCLAAYNKALLKHWNVTHILSVLTSKETPYPDDFKYLSIKVSDQSHVQIQNFFYECFQFIDEARMEGGGVLVHCRAGVSRSATIVIAYLMEKHNMNLSQALLHVRSRRPEINPNEGFLFQLQCFEIFLAGNRQGPQTERITTCTISGPYSSRHHQSNSRLQ